MQKLSCEVKFTIMIPSNLEDCPYVLFCSHGIHTHPPPPPSKAPESIMMEVVDIIRRTKDADLTLGENQLLTSYLLITNWFSLIFEAHLCGGVLSKI